MEYPFKFNECLLTDILLEKLGFIYWKDGAGDYNKSSIFLNEKRIEIYSMDERDDGYEGHCNEAEYIPYHFAIDGFESIYFLHELYQYVAEKTGQIGLDEFLQKCKDNNLMPFINSYNNYLSE